MTPIDKALELFNAGFNCSQAVFVAFAPSLGLDAQTALKVASGFGGGMGALGDTCGAVTGAFMALGLKFGHTDPADKAGKQKIYGLVAQLARQFEARCGSRMCRGLLGFDLSTPEGRQLAMDRDTHHTVCPAFVREAADILTSLLKD